MLQRFLLQYLYAGLKKEEYHNIQEALIQKNLNVLRMSSLMGALLLVGMTIFSYAAATLAQIRGLYCLTTAGMVLVCIASYTILPKHKKLIFPACYLFLLMAFLFGIVLGVIKRPDIPATTFCVLLVALPLLFMDRPCHLSLLLVTVVVIFCITATRVEPPQIAEIDKINAVSFLLLSIAVNYLVLNVKVRELIAQLHMERERDTDALTRLMTKSAVIREIDLCLQAQPAAATLFIMDIDHFKQINDRFGHAYGDTILHLIGDCLKQVFRKNDLLGRFGGDEFLVFLPGVADRALLTRRIEALNDSVRKIMVPECGNAVTISVGVAFYPEDASEYAALFEHADLALYDAKACGRNQCAFYTDHAKTVSESDGAMNPEGICN